MDLCVHLKICEGCGCLWYRAQTQGSVYCKGCETKLQDFPTPESRKRRGRPPQDAGQSLGGSGSNRGCSMSAALQLPTVWGVSSPQPAWQSKRRTWETAPAVAPPPKPSVKAPSTGPVISLGFYRKHTESLLRRYLYASMQVGRAPNILGDPIARGWCSSRPIRTFEDAVIFVLDVESA